MSRCWRTRFEWLPGRPSRHRKSIGSRLVREGKTTQGTVSSCPGSSYPPGRVLANLGLIGRHESAESHGLYQARLAHKGLIQQIAHDFQQDSGMLRSQVGVMGPRIAVAAEQHRAQYRKGLVVQVGEGADFLQGIEKIQLAPLAKFAKQGLRRAAAH